jgi:hypothetical protein
MIINIILSALAKALDCKICVQRDKFKILECLEDADLTKRLSLDFNDSFLHVLPMAKLKVEVSILNVIMSPYIA